MAIQWGLSQGPNAFDSAFQKGAQVGQAIKQQRTQNALSDYVTAQPQGGIVATPEQQAQSDQAWQTLAKSNPQLAMQVRQQEMQREAVARKERQGAIPTTINMLKAARANPQAYPAIRAEAIRLGIPGVENTPETFDPAWADQQLMTLEALSSPQGREALSAAGKIAADMGFRPGTPEYNAKVGEIWKAESTKFYPLTQGGGLAGVSPGQAAQMVIAPNPGGYAPGSPVQQTPTIQNTQAPQLRPDGNPQALTEQQYQATVARMGQERTDAWMARNNVPLAKTVGGQTYYRVNGQWYDNPEGR